jgi:hypothetical protein
MVGSGMIRLVWNSSPPNGGELRSGNTNPFVGSVRGGALPALSKMHRFGGTDTEQDAQRLVAGDPLRQRRVKAGAPLLDKPEVKACRIGDCLQMVRRSEVAVVAGNRRKLAHTQSLDCLRESVAEIGILIVAAVARPPLTLNNTTRRVRRSQDGVGMNLHYPHRTPDL